MQELSFAHFHTPIFFARQNWTDKIEAAGKHKGKIRIFLNKQEDVLMLQKDAYESFVPMSNVVSYTYLTAKEEPKAPTVQATERAKPGPKPKVSAQVSGPTHHVFDTGPGKTRD